MRMTDNWSGCVGCVIFTLISDPLVASPQPADSFCLICLISWWHWEQMIEFMLSSGSIPVMELLTPFEMSDIFLSVCQHWCTDLPNFEICFGPKKATCHFKWVSSTWERFLVLVHLSHVLIISPLTKNKHIAWATEAVGKTRVCLLIFKQRLWRRIAVVFIGQRLASQPQALFVPVISCVSEAPLCLREPLIFRQPNWIDFWNPGTSIKVTACFIKAALFGPVAVWST